MSVADKAPHGFFFIGKRIHEVALRAGGQGGDFGQAGAEGDIDFGLGIHRRKSLAA